MLTASPSQRIDKLRETSTTLKVLRRIARIHLISLGTEKVNLQLAVQADELVDRLTRFLVNHNRDLNREYVYHHHPLPHYCNITITLTTVISPSPSLL